MSAKELPASMKQTLSVVISAFNEGKKLDRTLSSVSWADEIIVVDNESTDNTKEIAQKYTKNIFSRPNDLMLNKNKNFGFGKATSAWILNLDGDEVITPELRREILTVLNKNDSRFDGYWIARKNIIFGKWITHGFWWPDRQLRLFRRGKGKFPCHFIHEHIKVDGASNELREPYFHYNYETISQYIHKLERCTTSEAAEYTAGGYTFSWYDAFRFPSSDFLKVYFAQGAYKDGLHGLVLSVLQAFYSFVIFAKLWEMRQFPDISIRNDQIKKEHDRASREFIYWQLSALLSEEKNPLTRILLRVRRKLL